MGNTLLVSLLSCFVFVFVFLFFCFFAAGDVKGNHENSESEDEEKVIQFSSFFSLFLFLHCWYTMFICHIDCRAH